MQYRQPGDLGVLREVFHGFSEEARTRGFPSPSFDGFGYIVAATNYSTNGLVVQSFNAFWFFLSDLEGPLWVISGRSRLYQLNVRFRG